MLDKKCSRKVIANIPSYLLQDHIHWVQIHRLHKAEAVEVAQAVHLLC